MSIIQHRAFGANAPVFPQVYNNSISPLSGLVMRPQWVVWKLVHVAGEPKPRKIPYNPKTLDPAASDNPTTWGTYQEAVNATVFDPNCRLGFMFTANDPFLFIDIDGCRNPDTGEIDADTQAICAMFTGAAWEVSQSASGLHIVGRVRDKTAFRDRRNKWGGKFECYTEGRFMALGNAPEAWQGCADTDITDMALAWVPQRQEAAPGVVLAGDRDPRWCGPEDDGELVRRMLECDPNDPQMQALDAALSRDPQDLIARATLDKKEAALARKQRINALWIGDENALGQLFPSETGDKFDHSAADLALINELGFWTGNDAERMLRIFSMSGLAARDKWQRKTYQQFTLKCALSSPREVYRGNREEQRMKVKRDNELIAAESEYKIHTDILSLDEMLDRLYFIESGSGGGGVADAASGAAWTMAIANNKFAASMETVTYVDGRSGKEKQKQVSALDLWRKDGKRKGAGKLTWHPGAPMICDVPGQADVSGFNTWRGIPGVRFLDHMRQDFALRDGWLNTWRNHLTYLFPVESERHQFEQWCAHIIQRPEELPQTGWCLIATQTGIGRNWLGSVLHRVIRGHVLGNVVLDNLLTGNFNGGMSRKLLVVVDEARAGMRGSSGWNNSEKLKTLVNPEFREINEKHGLQTVENNHMRWLTFSNNWDALPIDPDDRRWNFVENPTTRQPPKYYTEIYDTLRRPEFIAAVRAHLEGLDLTGFNHGGLNMFNAARDRVLRELATDLDIHLMEFRDTWPAPVARGADLTAFIARKMPGAGHNNKMLYKVAAKAGMTVTERLGREKTPFVIVDGKTTEAEIGGNPAHWLAVATDAAARFMLPGDMPGIMPPR